MYLFRSVGIHSWAVSYRSSCTDLALYIIAFL